ncbi:hypothetical protein HDU82_008448 [Entophlyctis luteolus]|nr:hypothetical protein HDU82_008448 [Entophlyctis luteolus]KAJ3378011.1 hypothetical protein HDU84_008025 [Entophlyctis sp. JEL0112]
MVSYVSNSVSSCINETATNKTNIDSLLAFLERRYFLACTTSESGSSCLNDVTVAKASGLSDDPSFQCSACNIAYNWIFSFLYSYASQVYSSLIYTCSASVVANVTNSLAFSGIIDLNQMPLAACNSSNGYPETPALQNATAPCDSKYYINGTKSAFCSSYGQFINEDVSNCTAAVTCPAGSPLRYPVNGTGGVFATFPCPGQGSVGSVTAYCQTNGQWSLTSSSCKPQTCLADARGFPETVIYYNSTVVCATDPSMGNITATCLPNILANNVTAPNGVWEVLNGSC